MATPKATRPGDLKDKQKAAIVDSLSQGAFITKAIEASGATADSYYRWRREDKGFDEACQTALESRVGRVEDALYGKAVGGNVTACIFWLCNRVKDRWQHVQHIEHQHAGQINHAHYRTTEEVEARIRETAQLLRDNPWILQPPETGDGQSDQGGDAALPDGG